ncbi:hypothetical protein GCM10009753_79190 [Streptantibioticus ferralitis]
MRFPHRLATRTAHPQLAAAPATAARAEPETRSAATALSPLPGPYRAAHDRFPSVTELRERGRLPNRAPRLGWWLRAGSCVVMMPKGQCLPASPTTVFRASTRQPAVG